MIVEAQKMIRFCCPGINQARELNISAHAPFKAIPRNEREWHRDEFAADGAKASDDACANYAVLP